jgi:D-3-phosphoglycerate dehydrogenase
MATNEKKYTILNACTQEHYLPLLEPLEKFANIINLKEDEFDKIPTFLKDCDIYIATLQYKIAPQVISQCPKLKLVATPTTGKDHLPVDELYKHNIEFYSLRESPQLLEKITATSELTWGLLLSLVRHIVSASLDVKEGNWRRELFVGSQLSGKTLGIIGLGRLGKHMANYGKAFGMNVIYYDIKEDIQAPSNVKKVSLNELLQSSDVVTLHIHLDKENINFFNNEKFALLKRNAILLNSSRGGVLDEDALLAALESGQIAAAGLDVLANELGDLKENKLIQYAKLHDNLLITPHCGGAAIDAQQSTFKEIITRIVNFLNSREV